MKAYELAGGRGARHKCLENILVVRFVDTHGRANNGRVEEIEVQFWRKQYRVILSDDFHCLWQESSEDDAEYATIVKHNQHDARIVWVPLTAPPLFSNSLKVQNNVKYVRVVKHDLEVLSEARRVVVSSGFRVSEGLENRVRCQELVFHVCEFRLIARSLGYVAHD